MDKIDLTKLSEIWNPFVYTIWIKCDTPVTKEEITEAINNNQFISPDVPKKMYLNFWDESTRNEHVERIAWFVKNFSDNFPINIDFGVNYSVGEISKFQLCDGNHRLAAAIYLNKPYIMSNCSGSVSTIDEFKYSYITEIIQQTEAL